MLTKAERMVIVTLGKSDMDSVTATLTTRVNLSITHLLAAAQFSRAVGELERRHAGQPLSDFWDSIQSNAIACVLTAIASLEAYANETFKDSEENFPNIDQAVLARMWEFLESKTTLEKLEFALLLRGTGEFETGKYPYQDITILTKLRNGLIHFKPESSDEIVEHEKISKKLRGRAVHSPFMGPPEILFPRAWASHSTTKWAVESTVTLMSTFAAIAGLKNRVAMFAEKLRAD